MSGNFQVVAKEGEVAVIQDNSTYERAIFPASTKIELMDEDEFSKGMPYGAPWEDFSPHPYVPFELRRRGLYFSEDVRLNPREVLAAIHTAYGTTARKLVEDAKLYEQNNK